jgi:hypothetical protein
MISGKWAGLIDGVHSLGEEMSRVFKVMVLLVALSLVSAVALQPATAYAGDVHVYQDANNTNDGDGSDTAGICGDPDDTGEGDPDSVGGGYGAHSGDNDLSGLLDGLFNSGDDDDARLIHDFIRFMLQQFMPNP